MTIKEYIQNNNITYTELAKRANISICYLSKLSRNQIHPSIRIKNSLEQLGIDVDSITSNEVKTKKDDIINELTLQVKRLKYENKVLKNKIIKSVDNTLYKLISPKVNLRVINFHDDDSNYLIQTNAPRDIISNALDYKDTMLINNDPNFRSDIEEVEDYVRSKGYIFNGLYYVDDMEAYEW